VNWRLAAGFLLLVSGRWPLVNCSWPVARSEKPAAKTVETLVITTFVTFLRDMIRDGSREFLVDIFCQCGILDSELMLEGKMFNSQDRKIHFGLLIMRFVGTSLGFINIGLPPLIFGFAILLLEALGAVSFVFGYFFRAACILLFIIFGLYFFNYFQIGYNTLMLWSLGLAAVFFGLIYVGPGRYAIAVKLEKK
jgi:uncharacterized membrane protein YphA (DoxX/SURF4 family)